MIRVKELKKKLAEMDDNDFVVINQDFSPNGLVSDVKINDVKNNPISKMIVSHDVYVRVRDPKVMVLMVP